MKTKFFLLLTVVIITLLSSCKKDPIYLPDQHQVSSGCDTTLITTFNIVNHTDTVRYDSVMIITRFTDTTVIQTMTIDCHSGSPVTTTTTTPGGHGITTTTNGQNQTDPYAGYYQEWHLLFNPAADGAPFPGYRIVSVTKEAAILKPSGYVDHWVPITTTNVAIDNASMWQSIANAFQGQTIGRVRVDFAGPDQYGNYVITGISPAYF